MNKLVAKEDGVVMRLRCFLILFLVPSIGFCQPSVALFQKLLNNPDTNLEKISCAKASQFQYVFVSGIFNELMPYYFQDYKEWLMRCRVLEKNIVIARPYSGSGLSRASKTLTELFNRMVVETADKPLIIVGHSKGAPEALLAAIESSPDTQSKIATIVSIQGSFGGSPIADLALAYSNDSTQLTNRLVFRVAKRLAHWLKRVETAYGKSVTDGVHSVKTQESRDFWVRYLNDHKTSEILSEHKLLVLQTYKHYRRLNPFFFLSGQYLDRITGERTDGAIPFSSQKPPVDHLETAVLELDHLDTVLPRSFSFSSAKTRYQLLASILGAI